MQGNCASKNSQVTEQRARVEALMTSLTEEIARVEQRFSNCLRQEPVSPTKIDANCNNGVTNG